MALSRSKRWVRLASLGFLIVIPLLAAIVILGVVAFWGFGLDRLGNATLGANFFVLAEEPPVPERRIYGLLAVLPVAALWLYAMARLFAMFWQFRRGEVMAVTTIAHLRSFALFASLSVIAGFLLSGVMRWAMGRFDDAPLWTHLGFSGTHAAVLFMAAIMFVASHIVEEGYAYKRETEDYV